MQQIMLAALVISIMAAYMMVRAIKEAPIEYTATIKNTMSTPFRLQELMVKSDSTNEHFRDLRFSCESGSSHLAEWTLSKSLSPGQSETVRWDGFWFGCTKAMNGNYYLVAKDYGPNLDWENAKSLTVPLKKL